MPETTKSSSTQVKDVIVNTPESKSESVRVSIPAPGHRLKSNIWTKTTQTVPLDKVKQGLCSHFLSMNASELQLMSRVLVEYENELTSKHLKQFYLDVQSLTPNEYRQRDQYQVYNIMITEYLKQYDVLKQKDVFSLLKVKPDSSPSRAMKSLISDNKMFCVTYKTQGAQVGYPAFQFDVSRGKIKPIIARVLDKLAGKYSDWDLAFWFNTYDDDLECTPIQAIDKPNLRSMLVEIADNEQTGCA